MRPLCLLAIAIVLSSCAPRRATVQPIGPATRQRVEAIIRASGAEVGVAMRTLDRRNELAINDTMVFHAASTMKVPVMVELFRQADAGRLALDQRIAATNRFRSIQDGSPYSLSPADDSETSLYAPEGQERSYRDLCELMITVSSNLATNVLVDRLGVESIRATTAALGAEGLEVRRGVEDGVAYRAGRNNTTTARGLMVMLQAIADGRAASPAACREMIEILERQKFNEGIPAGLPSGTPVAHKTGSITAIQHDAAIVYSPRPYVLVVLVRGLEDAKRGHALMAEVTRVIDESLGGAASADRRVAGPAAR